MKYSEERKEAVLHKLLPPQSQSVEQVSAAEGISRATLYLWRQAARAQGRLAPDDASAQGWSSRDKFTAVVETSALSEAEVSEYCRQRGLYPEQLSVWRQSCEQANDWERVQVQQLKTATQQDRGRIKELERDLQRKEKALAETAALLVLRKKAQAIWGEPEDA
jgi:transposase-like protein